MHRVILSHRVMSYLFCVCLFVHVQAKWIFFSLAVTLSEKNKSKSHSLQWVALCSARVFEWQHKDSLSFLNYFCPHLFYCHPTNTDCETGALQDTSNTMTTLKQFNYSYFSLRSLVSPDRSEGKYIRWVELMSLLITTVNVVRLPWFKESLQSFLGILQGSERKSNETLTSTERWSMKTITSPFSCTVLKWFIFGPCITLQVLNFSSDYQFQYVCHHIRIWIHFCV